MEIWNTLEDTIEIIHCHVDVVRLIEAEIEETLITQINRMQESLEDAIVRGDKVKVKKVDAMIDRKIAEHNREKMRNFNKLLRGTRLEELKKNSHIDVVK